MAYPMVVVNLSHVDGPTASRRLRKASSLTARTPFAGTLAPLDDGKRPSDARSRTGRDLAASASSPDCQVVVKPRPLGDDVWRPDEGVLLSNNDVTPQAQRFTNYRRLGW